MEIGDICTYVYIYVYVWYVRPQFSSPDAL